MACKIIKILVFNPVLWYFLLILVFNIYTQFLFFIFFHFNILFSFSFFILDFTYLFNFFLFKSLLRIKDFFFQRLCLINLIKRRFFAKNFWFLRSIIIFSWSLNSFMDVLNWSTIFNFLIACLPLFRLIVKDFILFFSRIVISSLNIT